MIGNRQPGARAFAGSIDEARLSRTIRSNQWIQTAFANQSNPGSFITLEP